MSAFSLWSDSADHRCSLDAILKHTTSATSSITLSQSRDAPEQSATARDDETQLISYEVPKQQTAAGVDEAQLDADQDTANPVACMSGLDQETLVTSSIPDVDVELSVVTSDMWTSAYSEALNSLEEDVKAVILQGKTAAELFSELDQLDKTASQESAIMKGVQHLKRLQVPLERLKLALDWATPLTSIEPITATVFGVVKGVTAVSSCTDTMYPVWLPRLTASQDCYCLFNRRCRIRQANRTNARTSLLYRRL